MKALTVRQPWAWAIATGAKTVENRVRRARGRGPLAIHAGGRWAALGGTDAAVRAAMGGRLTEWEREHGVIDPGAHRELFQFSAVIAVVEVVDCHLAEPGCCAPWGMQTDPDSGNRMFHWQLADARQLVEPVPAKGRLGLWTVDLPDQVPVR